MAGVYQYCPVENISNQYLDFCLWNFASDTWTLCFVIDLTNRGLGGSS